jgi:hypothetical protein
VNDGFYSKPVEPIPWGERLTERKGDKTRKNVFRRFTILCLVLATVGLAVGMTTQAGDYTPDAVRIQYCTGTADEAGVDAMSTCMNQGGSIPVCNGFAQGIWQDVFDACMGE